MPVISSDTRSALANSVATWATPRNIGRYFGFTAMQATIEILWQRERKGGDLGAVFTDRFVRDGSVAVDVGASFGLFSYHLARLVGRSGTVYSFEPHPMNRVVLEKLAKARSSVRFRPVAVSDEPGSAQLQVPVFAGRHVTAQSSLAHGFGELEGVQVETVSVPTVRLDDELGDRQVDFIKIDVEGHEIAVLKGAAAMLRKYLPPMLIEIEQRHLDYPISNVFTEITDLGYQLYFVNGSSLRPIDEFDLEKHQMFAVSPHEFTPFSMPEGYVYNFCAVAKADLLSGIPGFAG